MSHPTTGSPIESTFTTADTDHEVGMPGSVASGDLLIVAIAFLTVSSAGVPVVTTPDGWALQPDSLGTTSSTRSMASAIYKKIADGTEDGTTVNFVTDRNATGAAQCYQVAAAEWSGTLAEVESPAASAQTTATPDPPAITPSGGEQDYLVLVLAGHHDDAATVVSYSTNYTGGINTVIGGNNTGVGVVSQKRAVTASSEDPGSFTIDNVDGLSIVTLAIPPAAAGSASIVGDQSVPAFGQSAAHAVVAQVATAQAAPAFDQAAALDILGVATVAAAQAVPPFGGTVVLVLPDRMAGAQPVPGFGASAALAVLAGLTGAQQLPVPGQTAILDSTVTAAVAQTVSAFSQAASLGWVVPVPIQPVPHELILHIHTFH
jgi:hypothetical protein